MTARAPRDWAGRLIPNTSILHTRAPLVGAGLFDLRSLSTETLAQIYSSVVVGPGAEARFFTTIRRILIERGYGKVRLIPIERGEL